MSAIDELNDTINIDAASGKVEYHTANSENEDSVSIDASGPDIKTRINTASAKPQAHHKFVKQIPKRTPESAGGVKIEGKSRTIVDRSQIPVKEEKQTPEGEVFGTPKEEAIFKAIDVNNPNSMLNEWVKNKDAEAREWIAEKAEEQSVLSEEEDNDIDVSGEVIGGEYNTVIDNRKLVEDDELDLDFISSEEDKPMSEEIKNTQDLHEEDTDNIIINEIDTVDEVSDTENNNEQLIEEEKVALDIEEEETIKDKPIIVVDEEDEEPAADEDTDSDEVLKNLQKMITEKIKPISTKLDLSSFTIAKKPVSNINNLLADTSSRVVKWVLPNQNAIVKIKDFTGAELEKLREYSENADSVDSLNRRYKLIYDHIVSPKPQSFDVWLKCTPFSDIDHYFFAIYIANYKGANFLPVDCTNKDCKNTWVTDDINIMEMVKFEKDEDKKKFEALYHSEETAATGKGVYCTQAVAISPKFAIAFKEPSIYSVIEKRLIDDKTSQKYSAFVDYLPYIDAIYAIDIENSSLTPISYKEFPENATRNIRSKIQKYATIFDTFGADEFGPVRAYVRAISERNDGISYTYPELTCPKCGTVIQAEPALAEALVFTRYQLGSLTSTLLN